MDAVNGGASRGGHLASIYRGDSIIHEFGTIGTTRQEKQTMPGATFDISCTRLNIKLARCNFLSVSGSSKKCLMVAMRLNQFPVYLRFNNCFR